MGQNVTSLTESYFLGHYPKNRKDYWDVGLRDVERIIESEIENWAETPTNITDSPFLRKVPFNQFERVLDFGRINQFSKKVQNWRGIVLECHETYFIAKLHDLTLGGTDEEAEFDIQDVSPDDLSLLKKGAVFYWSVGYYMENSQIVKKSEIRFQRLITLDEFEIYDAFDKAENLLSKLKFISDDAANSTSAQ